jgi:hypothetical protein
MQMITFGHKKNQNMGAYSYMLMNFDLVKWRLASLKLMQHQPQEVIQEQNAMCDALKMVIKIYLDSHCRSCEERSNNLTK